MKTMLRLFTLLMVLSGCQKYPDQTLKDIDPDTGVRSCTLMGSISNITIQVNANSDFPAKLSGGVNDKLTMDECAFGSNGRDYTIVKNGARSITIGLLVDFNPALNSELFHADGAPKQGAMIRLKLRGRANCTDRETTVTELTRPVAWEPIYANGKDCGISGYTAIIH